MLGGEGCQGHCAAHQALPIPVEYPLEREPSVAPAPPCPPAPVSCTIQPFPTGAAAAQVLAFTLDPVSYLTPSTNNNYPMYLLHRGLERSD